MVVFSSFISTTTLTTQSILVNFWFLAIVIPYSFMVIAAAYVGQNIGEGDA